MIPFQVATLIDRAAYECGAQRDEILSVSRRGHVCEARHIAVYCARKLWGYSYPTLGEYFGRTHEAMRYAELKVQYGIEFDKTLARRVERVMEAA